LLQDLNTTSEKTRRFTRKSLPTTIDPTTDVQELTHYLSLPYPATIMECFDISNISSTHIVASMVQFREGRPFRKNYRRYRITSTNGQNDFASMAEVIRRRYSRQLQEALKVVSPFCGENQLPLLEQIREQYHLQGKESPLPDLIIVDGGKGQLSAACKELHQLGLQEIPIIGLAKEFEEIYRPGESQPLRLNHNNGALKLLQRIRDEAHRVANGYHQLLLRRRVSESLLDDIPGISSQKKKALLSRFGTISKLRRATTTEIALTPGIGKKLSEEIVNYLHQRKRKRYQLRSQ
jgi:excinuclease ABC subunit C